MSYQGLSLLGLALGMPHNLSMLHSLLCHSKAIPAGTNLRYPLTAFFCVPHATSGGDAESAAKDYPEEGSPRCPEGHQAGG